MYPSVYFIQKFFIKKVGDGTPIPPQNTYSPEELQNQTEMVMYITEALKATREEVVEQWRKSIDEEGLSCARKIEEAVKEERERIAQLIYDILPTNKVIKESAVGWGKEGTDRYKGYLSGAKDVSGLVSWEITSFAKELKIEALTEVNNDKE